MVRQVLGQDDLPRLDDGRDGQEQAVGCAVRDQDAVLRRLDTKTSQPGLRRGAMVFQPRNGSARAHEGAVVALGEAPHDRAGRLLMRLGVARTDDGEIYGLAGIAVEHEAVGLLRHAAADEGAPADLAPQIAPPLGLLVAEAHSLH
jgi:hypothetical protein